MSIVNPLERFEAGDGLPDYALELAAFHRAFYHELCEIIDLLPLHRRDRVLDVGCGDGFYTGLIAEQLRTPGKVIGIDANPTYLEIARHRLADDGRCGVEFRRATLADALSAAHDRYDVVWCAQSLYSFDEPEETLEQMARAVRPGGIVAVLENDTLHQLLMPWPTTIELTLRQAERDAFEAESLLPGKYYVGRRLPALLAAAGLEPLGYCTRSADRMAPLDPTLELFLKRHLETVFQRAAPYLSPAIHDELSELVRPAGKHYMPHQPHFTLTWLNVLCWGRRPS